MDDSQTPGDIAHAPALNDGQLLFTPLSNYLYRFVFVGLSALWTCCVFLSVVEILHRGMVLFLEQQIAFPLVYTCSLKEW